MISREEGIEALKDYFDIRTPDNPNPTDDKNYQMYYHLVSLWEILCAYQHTSESYDWVLEALADLKDDNLDLRNGWQENGKIV